jgi:hypothetical protein
VLVDAVGTLAAVIVGAELLGLFSILRRWSLTVLARRPDTGHWRSARRSYR